MLKEINDVFVMYIMHRNVEGVVTRRAKLCQVQHQDNKKSFPQPPLSLTSVSWQLRGFSLREMSEIASPSSVLWRWGKRASSIGAHWEPATSMPKWVCQDTLVLNYCYNQTFLLKVLFVRKCCSWFLLVSQAEVTGLTVLHFPSLTGWPSSPTPDFYF